MIRGALSLPNACRTGNGTHWRRMMQETGKVTGDSYIGSNTPRAPWYQSDGGGPRFVQEGEQ